MGRGGVFHVSTLYTVAPPTYNSVPFGHGICELPRHTEVGQLGVALVIQQDVPRLGRKTHFQAKARLNLFGRPKLQSTCSSFVEVFRHTACMQAKIEPACRIKGLQPAYSRMYSRVFHRPTFPPKK